MYGDFSDKLMRHLPKLFAGYTAHGLVFGKRLVHQFSSETHRDQNLTAAAIKNVHNQRAVILTQQTSKALVIYKQNQTINKQKMYLYFTVLLNNIFFKTYF